jgi:serine/threonine protein phosphatase PrpC
MAAAGDSRAILCTRNTREQWRALPLTIDHRPRRTSERER